jgi:hypothetical protein
MAKSSNSNTSSTKTTTRRTSQVSKLRDQVATLKADLKTSQLQVEEVMESNHAIARAFNNNQTKLQQIVNIILERFDGDGNDDIYGLDSKITWWWVIRNINTIAKMIREIVDVIRDVEDFDLAVENI